MVVAAGVLLRAFLKHEAECRLGRSFRHRRPWRRVAGRAAPWHPTPMPTHPFR